MMKNILMWDVQGLGTSKRRVKKLVRNFDVSIVAIVEPFQRVKKLKIWAESLGLHNYAENVQVRGKLWICWKHDIIVDTIDVNT